MKLVQLVFLNYFIVLTIYMIFILLIKNFRSYIGQSMWFIKKMFWLQKVDTIIIAVLVIQEQAMTAKTVSIKQVTCLCLSVPVCTCMCLSVPVCACCLLLFALFHLIVHLAVAKAGCGVTLPQKKASVGK